MSDLPPEVTQLLRSARADLQPDEAEIAALRSAVAAQIGMASGPWPSGHAAAGGTSPAALSGAAGGAAAKLVGVVLLASAMSGAAVWGVHRQVAARPSTARDATALTRPAPVAADPATAPPAEPEPPTVPVEDLPITPVEDMPLTSLAPGALAGHARSLRSPLPVHGPAASARAAGDLAAAPGSGAASDSLFAAAMSSGVTSSGPAPSGATATTDPPWSDAPWPDAPTPASEPPPAPAAPARALPAPAAPTASLAGEVQLLREAQTALDHGDARTALALVRRHEARYPGGTLREERLVLRAFALCALGQPEAARAAAREIWRSAPDSPHLAGLRASCVGSDFGE